MKLIMRINKKMKALFTLTVLLISFNVKAFDFEQCRQSVKTVITDTNQLQQYGEDLGNSVSTLVERNPREAGRYLLMSTLVPSVRDSGTSIFVMNTFYDAMDFKKFNKTNADNMFSNRLIDFYNTIELSLNYFSKDSAQISDSSTREDAKNITRELRVLQAKFRFCKG